LSRAEYVLGKMAVLVITLSWITWVPGLLLFVTQASLSGWSWFTANLWMAGGIIASSLIWILVLSVLSLALSAWVKWRIVAGALLLAIFFVGAGFAQAVNAVLQTTQGYVLDIGNLILTIQRNLFREAAGSIPVSEAWIALLIFSAIFLSLLLRRIRPNEVVR